MLATGIHAQPGVYALLLGSGVSRSAGISTGWEIVQHLVQKAAAADNPDDAESQDLAASDPEAWWAEHGEGALGYSSLLAAIAPSSAARQGLLAEYFDATEEDRAAGLKVPTAAHNAIAGLVKAGSIKVIVTTNFDRLMEQALEAVGVAPQLIARAEAVPASTPLAHAEATVIKLHGDWKDLEFRNTTDELDNYPQQWIDLLRQVFNEYGLVISGWSADWDRALVRVLEATPRRYPLYWDSRSSKSNTAKNLLVQHGGHTIEAESADELFTSLSASVDALTRLAQPTLTTAMAIARLKRALPNPLLRIEVQDLLSEQASLVAPAIAGIPERTNTVEAANISLDQLFEASKPILSLLVQVVRYDDGTHTRRLSDALQTLMDARRKVLSWTTFDSMQHYPALLALRAMSIEAVRVNRDDVMVDLLLRPRWRGAFNQSGSTCAAQVLHQSRIFDDNDSARFPRLAGRNHAFPTSGLLRLVLEEFFGDLGVDAATYRQLCDDVEYRTGLVQFLLDTQPGDLNANAGEYLRETRRSAAEERFRESLTRSGGAGWGDLLANDVETALTGYGQHLDRYGTYF
jgi:hypothetical protein